MAACQEKCITDLDFYMSLACISAKRSKDPNTKVGACIVDDMNKVVGLGYNGMPNGCSDRELPWGRQGEQLDTKYPYVCHAELNAITNTNSCKIEGSVIYSTCFPCNECAKLIIQSDIKEVIFLIDKYPTSVNVIAAKRLFDMANVIYKKHIPQIGSILFTFKPELPFEILQNSYASTDEDDHISWENYFMAVACLAAARSGTKNLQVGVCIVNNKNRIVAIGYNEPHFMCGSVDNEKSDESLLCSAVMKAVSMKNSSSLMGYTIFTTRFPCHNCTKIIIHNGIRDVIYLTNNNLTETTEPSTEEINFSDIKFSPFKAGKNISINLSDSNS